jgi:hypothetical protein
VQLPHRHDSCSHTVYRRTRLVADDSSGTQRKQPMRPYGASLPRSARTLRRSWSTATGKMTMCIFSWSIRPRWPSPLSSIASKECPRGVSGNSTKTLPHGITRACCGRPVTLRLHAEARRCPSFVSTLKTKGKTCDGGVLRGFLITFQARHEAM